MIYIKNNYYFIISINLLIIIYIFKIIRIQLRNVNIEIIKIFLLMMEKLFFESVAFLTLESLRNRFIMKVIFFFQFIRPHVCY